MNGCTATDKPPVSILLAVYEPDLDWLRQQLLSLERQTYPNLRLYVRDDGSETVSREELEALVRECIRSFPAEVHRNGKNLGSNGTFQRLIMEAEGEYLCCCDQDDVWFPEKTAVLEKAMEDTGSLLVCSDMHIMDASGNTLTESITDLRRHHVFHSGEGLSRYLWRANFASGCASMVKASAAKAAIPFSPHMVYDHYIALWCAAHGRITSLPEPLLAHREHGDNQTSLLQGVTDAESYERIRIRKRLDAALWLRDHFPCDEPLRELLPSVIRWLEAREKYAAGDRKAGKTMWQLRKLGRAVTVFELCLPHMPGWLLRLALGAGRRNLI